MRRYIFLFLFLCIVVAELPPLPVQASSLADRLAGRVLLEVESYGRAWYVDPVSDSRYYLADGQTAMRVMRSLGLGISNRDLAKIPTAEGQTADQKLVARLKGRILLQVQDHGEAWYVNPVDGLRYYLAGGDAAFALWRRFGLGISDDDLRKIPMNDQQITFDAAFDDVAYVTLRAGHFYHGYHDHTILPIASVTKLMTALVAADYISNWQRSIVITAAEINYPHTIVGNDTTSEVDLQAGDRVTLSNLLAAMMISSSNQAAVAVADATGLTRSDFVAQMNAKAKALDMSRSAFVDPTGLDARNVATPRDLARLAQAAFAVPRIASAAGLSSYTFSVQTATGSNRSVTAVNRNYSLLDFHYTAAKTGYLVEAKLTVAMEKQGAIYVVLHADSSAQRNTILRALLE